MGDILSGVFGGGSSSSQDVNVDPTTRNLNALRLEQAGNLFGNAGLGDFGKPGGNAYQQSPELESIRNYAYNAGNVQPQLNFADWYGGGTDRSLLNQSLDRGQQQLGSSRAAVVGDFNAAINNTANAFQGQVGRNADVYNNALGMNYGAFNSMFNANKDIFNQNLGLGIDASRNYVNQIATPSIMQQMSLAGLDSSGAAPAAIAKASAETGLPLMQSLLPAYMQQQGALGGQYMGEQAGLGQAYMGQQGGLGQNYMGMLASLGGQYGATDASMLSSAMQGERGLFGTYMPSEMSFRAGAPGVASQYAMLPYQAGAMAANTAGAMYPMADYGRHLQEQDLLRRQGLSTTAFTGLPYTPSTSTDQNTNTKPLWNLFGMG